MINLIVTLLIFNIPITKIDFVGNKSIGPTDLQLGMISKKGDELSRFNLIYDAQSVVYFYKSNGFFATEVTPEVDTTEQVAQITFAIEEGPRPQIGKIIVSSREYERIENLFNIKINDFFIKFKIDSTKIKIENYYKDRGYPFAKIVSSMMPDSGLLFFNIEKGSLHYIRNIEIRGLKVCRPTVVRREIDLAKGDLFSKSKLFMSQRAIYSLGFFSTVDVEIQKQEPDSVDLLFTMRELKSRILNFGAGFSIPISLLLSFGIEELNLFNAGHGMQIQTTFKINMHGEWESKIDGKYTIPNIMPARLTLSLLPFYWVENDTAFTRKTRGAEVRVSKVFTEHVQFNIANQYKLVDFQPKVILPDTFKGHTNSIKLQLMFDYRNEFFNPRTGLYLLPVIEYAGGIFGGDNDFMRFEIEQRIFLPLFKNTLAQRLKIGKISPTGDFAVYEEYYLGGQSTVRGYPERSFGPDSIAQERYGKTLVNLNLEYRMYLPRGFGIVTFLDMGYIDNELNFAHTEYLKFSAGLGLRYYTPIGPIRGDVGFPLSKADHKPELYLGIYHIF